MRTRDSETEKLLQEVNDNLNSHHRLDSEILNALEREKGNLINSTLLPGFQNRSKDFFNRSVIKSLEEKLERIKSMDFPAGEALLKHTVQLTPRERTDEYKSFTLNSYKYSLDNLKSIYKNISRGYADSSIHNFVESFVITLMTDKNILLNLSNIQPSGEDYLYHHSLNSCLISMNIATASGYSKNQIIEIGCGALLADIGMMLIPEKIRFKKGQLSRDEQFEIYKHPVIGYDLLSRMADVPEAVRVAVYQHHERDNQRGYPKGSSKHLIHNYAKIIGIADVYMALIAPRTYRKSFKPYDAMKIVIQMANQGILDIKHVKNFVSYMSLFPVGSFVKLKSGKIAKVIQANESMYSSPVVSVIFNEKEEIMGETGIYQVDLASESEEKVVLPLGKPRSLESIMVGF
jgi:HD-GYP domain-containing protein (c-di-GMP phosphodiesterase class II)